MIRLDSYIQKSLDISRKDAKALIKSKQISVNGSICLKDDIKINEAVDIVFWGEKKLIYEQFVYYMLNKPQGVISATQDNFQKTVVDLIDTKKGIFPIGRLDIDTTGLLILTNDGELSHELLSPNHHVDKVYNVELDGEIDSEKVKLLEAGIPLDGKITKEAKIEILNKNHCNITIHEGKFHQVKRMFKYVGLNVISLKRISFGPLKLDNNLALGEYRHLTNDEINLLKNKR